MDYIVCDNTIIISTIADKLFQYERFRSKNH
jgi:hypothetical protein